MALKEDLNKTYRSIITPNRFGSHFNEREKPDALGRMKATLLEIQRAISGEFNLSPQQPATNPERLNERVLSEWRLLKQAREQRQAKAKKARNYGGGHR